MPADSASPTPIYKRLYFQVLLGIALGIVLGAVDPHLGKAMKPLGDGFIKLIRMVITPIIFGTVVVGIAKMGDMKAVGRIGAKALIYFEVVSSLALLIGLVLVNVLKPGQGLNADAATLDPKAVAAYANTAAHLSIVDFLLNIIPSTVVDAFARGEILQVLMFSILFGLALLHLGEKGKHLVHTIDEFTNTMFGVVGIIMWVASIGSFGAIAFTVSQFGLASLLSLGKLLLDVVIGCAVFLVLVLNAVSLWAGVSLWKIIRYINEEILIVLGTSSSETVLPRLMAKLEHLGCARPVVGLVVPTGYSFNLDGTSIYMSMAAIFIAQATNTHLTLAQQLGILAVLLLTSKGAAAVTGAGFVTLAATLSAIPVLPVAGLGLLLGIDPFMSRARSFTNLVGNTVGALVIARAEGALDVERMHRVLNGELEYDGALLEGTLVVDTPGLPA
jgi:aerobic C4-dicarboxylate transport protein